jgi:hypothetical protein
MQKLMPKSTFLELGVYQGICHMKNYVCNIIETTLISWVKIFKFSNAFPKLRLFINVSRKWSRRFLHMNSSFVLASMCSMAMTWVVHNVFSANASNLFPCPHDAMM